MAIGIYARVSTADQRCEVQLEALRAYTQRRGDTAVEFVDRGVSGAKDRRPALDKLLQAARRREVSAVVVTKLDRLARSVRHLLNIAAELEALGVALVILDQALDTGTPTGRLLFQLLGSIAEFERELIRERQAAGIARAKRHGTRSGRPFGRTSAVSEAVRKRVVRLHAGGRSVRQIACMVGLTKSTVGRLVAH
jgi:DNA invertase Pin-like site-specific DNA recombinase